MQIVREAIVFLVGHRLAMPALLFCINLACAAERFSSGDPKRGIYWLASAVCIAAVSI